MHRITQREIAQQIGCSQVTVSRALSGDRRVEGVLRARIQAEASRLGYRPDAMLRALVSFRRRGSARSLNSSLAFIYAGAKPSPGTLFSNYEYYLGCSQKAQLSGFSLELHQIQPDGKDGDRLARMLYHRGVKGIIFALSSAHLIFSEPMIDLPNFAAVVLGYNFTKQPVNCIMPDHYNSIKVAIAEARARGYRRIGLLASETLNERVEHAFTDGFRRSLRHIDADLERRIHLFCHKSPAEIEQLPTRLDAWLDAADVDVVIGDLGGWRYLEPLLVRRGRRLGEDFAFICLDLRARSDPELSGLVGHRTLMGELAVENLFTQIMNNSLGRPAAYQRILIQSEWRERCSCPKRLPAASQDPPGGLA